LKGDGDGGEGAEGGDAFLGLADEAVAIGASGGEGDASEDEGPAGAFGTFDDDAIDDDLLLSMMLKRARARV